MNGVTYHLEVEDKNLRNRFNVRTSIYGAVPAVQNGDAFLAYEAQKAGEKLQREVAEKYGEVADAAAQVLVHLLGDPMYQPYMKLYGEQYSPAVRRLHEALYKMGVPEARKYTFTTLNTP